MGEVQKPSNGEPLTCGELIRSELGGKVAASGAYDAILWRIRTGYVIVLYGALTIAGATNTPASPWVMVILVTGFSIAAGFIDYQFLSAKLTPNHEARRLFRNWQNAGLLFILYGLPPLLSAAIALVPESS